AELQRTYGKRLKRKPGCFDCTVAQNDCRSRAEGERLTDALYAEIYRRNGITSEVEPMYLHARDQENATAQIPISCVPADIIAKSVHDEGRATELVEGEKAGSRGHA